jgi:hypothetical protein
MRAFHGLAHPQAVVAYSLITNREQIGKFRRGKSQHHFVLRYQSTLLSDAISFMVALAMALATASNAATAV